MLDLVAYDLRQPRSQRHLERGIRACSIDQRNVHYAPWFMETLVEPSRAIKTIRESLGSGREDDLLVLELGHNVSAACHNPHSQQASMRWLKSKGVDFRGLHGTGVLAIAYTLHGANSTGYARMTTAIETRFPDHFKPVSALWFAATDLSPRRVRDELRAFLPDPENDELLVMSIPPDTVGQSGLWAADPKARKWFRSHRLQVN
jgi:hypothetical protein